MDSEGNEERRSNNESRDRFGYRLWCSQCQGNNVEVQQCSYRDTDRYVPGLEQECKYWLEWHCTDCGYYRGAVIQ